MENEEDFIIECDKKYFHTFRKNKNPMDSLQQAISAAFSDEPHTATSTKIQKKGDE